MESVNWSVGTDIEVHNFLNTYSKITKKSTVSDNGCVRAPLDLTDTNLVERSLSVNLSMRCSVSCCEQNLFCTEIAQSLQCKLQYLFHQISKPTFCCCFTLWFAYDFLSRFKWNTSRKLAIFDNFENFINKWRL